MKAIKNKRLRLEDRMAIEAYLGYGIPVSKIAMRIGKGGTAFSKEIRKRRHPVGSRAGDCRNSPSRSIQSTRCFPAWDLLLPRRVNLRSILRACLSYFRPIHGNFVLFGQLIFRAVAE